jgi:hypothetical protein
MTKLKRSNGSNGVLVAYVPVLVLILFDQALSSSIEVPKIREVEVQVYYRSCISMQSSKGCVVPVLQSR